MCVNIFISSPQVMQLRDTLQSTSAEKEHLLSEATKESLACMAELERMQADITSMTQERDQLLELRQGLREEMLQLKKELEEKDAMVKGKKHIFLIQTNTSFIFQVDKEFQVFSLLYSPSVLVQTRLKLFQLNLQNAQF